MSEKINASLIPDNAITEISGKIYDDVAHKTLTQIGDVSESLMKLVFLPFKCLGMTVDELEKKYKFFIEKTINKVPQNKLVAPDIIIASQILEHVKYVFTEDILVEMFSNLLATDMNIDSKSIVHPSFVDVLSKMNAFDAKVLLYFYNSFFLHECLLSFSVNAPSNSKNESVIFIDTTMITSEINLWSISSTFLKSVGVINISLDESINYKEFKELLRKHGEYFEIPKLVKKFFRLKVKPTKNEVPKFDMKIITIINDNLINLLNSLKNKLLNEDSFKEFYRVYTLTKYGRCFVNSCIHTSLNEYTPKDKSLMAIEFYIKGINKLVQ